MEVARSIDAAAWGSSRAKAASCRFAENEIKNLSIDTRAASQLQITDSELIKAQLGALPHAPLLTNLSGLKGRVGIIGGTFDPVHNAHIEIGRLALARHKLDAIVYIPAARNPLKDTASCATPGQRVEMLERALRNDRSMFVCPIEARQPGPSFTVDTLKQIYQEIEPSETELFLLVGADVLRNFNLWKDYKTITSLATVIPVKRSGDLDPGSDRETLAKLGAALGAEFMDSIRCNVIDGPPYALSATSVRERIRRGNSVSQDLDPEVLAYIVNRGLYRE